MSTRWCFWFFLFMMPAYAVKTTEAPVSIKNGYVGQKVCSECHFKQSMLWSGSDHDQAMQLAGADTVLGDFSQVDFIHHGNTSTFYLQNNHYKVKTTGPDGKLHDYTITYTFGFYPLQQYLITMPDGRLQVLDIAWDNRPVEQGGQRWYPLNPDPVDYRSQQHWSNPSQSWNARCADCHSTKVEKNFNSETNVYTTQWSEIDVSCEACHGPGGQHIEWARSQPPVDQQPVKPAFSGLTNPLASIKKQAWKIHPDTGKPYRQELNQEEHTQEKHAQKEFALNRTEVETCARCHSQRQSLKLSQPGDAFMDNFRPAFIQPELYHSDGQAREQAYVYGSFLQSTKYQAGVSCSDCHDAHMTELRLPGDRVCNQCHLSEQYRTQKHHHHTASSHISCLDCHMPTVKVMGVDRRHDHRFSTPDPQLTRASNSPNACNQCHTDKVPQWAVENIRQWYNRADNPNAFAHVLDAQRKKLSDANQQAVNLLKQDTLPVIQQATVLSQLSPVITEESLQLLKQQLQQDNEMIRVAGLIALDGWQESQQADFGLIAELAFPLLSDPVMLVRIEAARLLAPLDETLLEQEQQEQLRKARQEYIDSQLFNADRPESLLELGDFYLAMTDLSSAEQTYRQVLTQHPALPGAWVKFSQFYSELDRDEDAIQTLKRGIEQIPDSSNADLYHAMGLAQIRINDFSSAIVSLATAAMVAPQNPHYAYVYAIALNTYERPEEALSQLQKAHQQFPQNREILTALATINQKQKNYKEAMSYAEILLALDPDNSTSRQLIKQLKSFLQ